MVKNREDELKIQLTGQYHILFYTVKTHRTVTSGRIPIFWYDC